MTPEQAMAFFLFALVAAGTPGPANLILTSVGARVGVARGLACLLGVTLGTAFIMFVMAFGLGSLVRGHPLVLQWLKWVGAAFLLWLAFKVVTAGHSRTSGDQRLMGFWGAAAFQWINPKSWMASAGAVGAYLHPDAGGALVQSLYFGLVFFLAAFPACFLWLAFGASIQRLLVTPKTALVFNWAMGLMLAASVVFFVC